MCLISCSRCFWTGFFSASSVHILYSWVAVCNSYYSFMFSCKLHTVHVFWHFLVCILIWLFWFGASEICKQRMLSFRDISQANWSVNWLDVAITQNETKENVCSITRCSVCVSPFGLRRIPGIVSIMQWRIITTVVI